MKPVLIYQMGKVGSAAIRESLKLFNIENYQVHYLQLRSVNNLIERSQKMGLKIPPHLMRSQKILETDLLNIGGLKIITLFRDPVSRNVSAYFQNLQKFFPGVSDYSTLKSKDLITKFEHDYSHDVSINWFDSEFKKTLNFDMIDMVGEPADNYNFKLPNGNELLALKVESEDSVKIEAIKKFLGINDFELMKVNIGAEKSYAEEYRVFKSKIRLSSHYLEKMYGARFTQTLYTESEISAMRSKWEK